MILNCRNLNENITSFSEDELKQFIIDELKNRSATGVHAGVAPSNKAGLAFWTNKGLGIVRDDRPATIWCGMRF